MAVDPEQSRRIRRALMDRNCHIAFGDPSTHPLRLERLRQRRTILELAADAGLGANAVQFAELQVAKTRPGTWAKLANALDVPVERIQP
jgi:hypothetical protein